MEPIRIKNHVEWKQESRQLLKMVFPDGSLGYVPMIRHVELKEALRTLAAGIFIFAVCLFLFFVAGVM